MNDDQAVETPEAPPIEYFGDPIEDDDLSALDRGDVIEDVPETPAVEEPAVEPKGDTPAEPEASGEPPEPEVPAAAEGDGEVVEPEGATDPDPEEIMIPKARLDLEIQKRKAYEARIAEMESQPAPAPAEPEAPAFDISAKIQDEYKAVIEGDLEKAAAIRMEISEYTQAEQEKSIQSATQQASTMTKEQLAFEDKVAELTEQFPAFDPDHVEFQPELLKDVLFKRDAYAQAGMNLTDALDMATKEVAVMKGIAAAAEPQVTETNETPVVEKKEKLSAVEKKEIETSVKKKLDAAAAQPPEIQGESSASHGERALNIEEMTEEEFDALPEATIKRYRGD